MTLKYIFQETGLSAIKAAWWKSSPGFSHAAFFKMIFLHVRYQLFHVIIARYLHLQGNSLLSSIAHFLKHCTQQSFSLFFMHNRAFRHSPSWFAAANCLKQDRLQAHALYKYRFSVHWQSYFQPGRQSPFHLSQHFLNILPFQHAYQTDSSIFPAGCHSFTAWRILALFAWHHSTTNVSHTDRLSTALLSVPLLPGEFSRYSHDIIQRPTFRTLTDCPQHSCQFLYRLANSRVISPSQHSMTAARHTGSLSTAACHLPAD